MKSSDWHQLSSLICLDYWHYVQYYRFFFSANIFRRLVSFSQVTQKGANRATLKEGTLNIKHNCKYTVTCLAAS